ncbi:MAG: ATP-binding protein [Chloroflexi bacterium]|nr:ATP-binding protein [Chloroflexota bacterium]
MRLGMKLTLAFLVVGLLGVALVALLAGQTTQRLFRQFIFDEYQASLVERLRTYYSEHQGWTDIAEQLPQIEGVPSARPAPARPPGNLTLADSGATVVAAGMGYHLGEHVPEGDLAQAKAIEVDGQTVGWVLAARERFADSPAEAAFVNRINTALALAAVGAVLLSLVVGAALARAISRPIQELTAATGAVAEGNLSQKVEVRSHDELGQLAASFNLMSEKLARVQNLRRQMTADIAHELRTPLSVVLGYADAVEEGTLPPTPETMAVIRDEALHLERLIDDLLTLSHADAGELRFTPRPARPLVLLEEAARAFQPQASQKDIRLIVEPADDVTQVWLDPDRMGQVLRNLLSNALRHTPAHGEVRLSAARSGETLEMRVSDNGPGIAPEDLPHVFERFYRADRSRARESGGSGLGLAIARSIVASHGGTIAAESTLGQGTTIVIRLPLGGAATHGESSPA